MCPLMGDEGSGEDNANPLSTLYGTNGPLLSSTFLSLLLYKLKFPFVTGLLT